MTDVVIIQADAPPEPEPEVVAVPVLVPVEAPPEPEPVAVVEPVPDYAGMVVSLAERVAVLEQRASMTDANWVAMRGDLDGRAFSEHEHPVDEDLRIIADELRALREEENGPDRGPPKPGWLTRWLNGGR